MANWYDKYMTIYGKPFSEVPQQIVDETRERLARLQSPEPLASIVVIGYNEETHLQACLWAISEIQCKYPVEIIGVDNDSKDRTAEIYQKSGIPYYTEYQHSCGYARRCGLQHAKGRFYFDVDSDTLYPPQYYEVMLDHLLKPGVACVSATWSYFPDANHSALGLRLFEMARDLFLWIQHFKRPELSVRGLVFAYNADYGRKEPYRVDIIRGEDGSMAFNLKKYGKIVFVRDRRCRAITGYGTIGNQSMWQSFVDHVKIQMKGITRIFHSTNHYKDTDDNLIAKKGTAMKIVYVVGGLLAPNGMSSVLSAKINYLAEHTDYELYMILTEKAGQEWYYHVNPKVKWVNFDINFDELDTMPLLKKFFFYQLKQRKYKKLFTDYLMEIRPDITVSTVRREINFINDIKDGSRKIGEIHFNKSNYRNINLSFLPASLNKRLTNWWMGRLIRQISKLNQFVVLTHKDATYWKGMTNMMVIPNFITHFPIQLSSCKNRNVIAVGRYDYVKGFDLLIPAWQKVHKEHPDWQLNIYGSGQREVYQRMADERGLHKVLHCNGPVSDIDSRYVEASLFVLSSRNEGFGLVIVEAMAAGLPVVSFDCPCGPSDIIHSGEDGLLVENGDIDKMADAICRMIEHPEERCQYGKGARRNAMRFSQEEVMQQWIQLFNSLV